MRALAFKLKRLKTGLREWNSTIFRNVFDAVTDSERRVALAESAFDANPTPEAREALSKEQANLLLHLCREEIFWRQKAHVKWAKDGDANTKFFHMSVKDRHRRQRINSIRNDEGVLLDSQPQIQNEAVRFFTHLYQGGDSTRMDELLTHIPTLLQPNDHSLLLQPVTLSEVKQAVWELDPDSAAGPNGFTGLFFRHCWDLIADDVLFAVLDFFAGVPIPWAFSTAQIVLLPKKLAPSSFTDYRPICLCTFMNKVFTGLLATRIRPLLPRLISPEQSGFIVGREIHENILLALEMVNSLESRCRGMNIIVKLDMQKAFDRVSWSFLQAVLLKFGFPARLVELRLSNLRATRLSVLINGASCGFFQPTRGVKKGDPLSPYLFILMSEALSRVLNSGVAEGRIGRYEASHRCSTVSHLAFVDDFILFLNGKASSLRALKDILSLYQEASGQQINLEKNFFVPPKRCSPSRQAVLERHLGMRRSALPFKYLGINLYRGRNKSIYYHHILEKVDGKLNAWKSKLLSPGAVWF